MVYLEVKWWSFVKIGFKLFQCHFYHSSSIYTIFTIQPPFYMIVLHHFYNSTSIWRSNLTVRPFNHSTSILHWLCHFRVALFKTSFLQLANCLITKQMLKALPLLNILVPVSRSNSQKTPTSGSSTTPSIGTTLQTSL